MKTSSAKDKGRRLQQKVRDLILNNFPMLTENDVRSTSMGVSGSDIQLSEEARRIFPFSVECKNQESLSIWSALKQAASNANGLIPTLIFKRNHSKTYVCVEIDDFIKILNGEHNAQ